MAGKITTAEQAVETIKEISAPNITEKAKEEKSYAVADYLKQNPFRTLVDGTVKTASVRPYYAGLYNLGGNIVRFQPTEPYDSPKAAINVWFVPRVSIDSVIANKNKVPAQSLAIIDITKSQPPFICTEKLTGCCFVIGWNEKKGVMYMCHIEPSSMTHDRHFIANYVRDNEILPVSKSELSKIHTFGGDDRSLPDAYHNYTVSIIGFILKSRIWMVFRFEAPPEHGSFGEYYEKK